MIARPSRYHSTAGRWRFDLTSGTVRLVPTVYFDEKIAGRYDADYADMFSPAVVDPAVNFLARLAGDGGAQEIGVSIGDFTTTKVDGTFRVAYLVFNAIMSLTTQEAQVECFRNVATHLEPGGCFVIEVMVPDLRRLPPGQNVVPFQVDPAGWGYDVYDVATQSITSNHVRVTDDGSGEHTTFPGRYVWAAELDLMARLAGMTLRERWGGWQHEHFTGESAAHVSVWEKFA